MNKEKAIDLIKKLADMGGYEWGGNYPYSAPGFERCKGCGAKGYQHTYIKDDYTSRMQKLCPVEEAQEFLRELAHENS